MYVSFNSTILDYYAEQYGLPFIAENLDGQPMGFIFAQPGGYATFALVPVHSVEEMHQIAG